MPELDKTYDHAQIEDKIYQKWIDSGYFNPDNLPERHKEPYTIIMPPPNVTGTLHLGHTLMTTIEDILIRWQRMQGKKTLWLPGTDHAAIATQSKVEKLLEKEGRRKHDLGHEEFLKQVENFAKESHDTIIKQLKSMGASADWSKEAFTLDEQRNLAVRTAFKKFYDLGLIYRAHRVVNWDVKGQTTISDDEVVYQERDAILYTFIYSKDFPIEVATTRLETKIGDTAVAVHPDDERYQKYIGKEYKVKLLDIEVNLKIIADKYVDPNFGSGALGVTPAHSMQDYEIAQRHNLPLVQVIDERGKMTIGAELTSKKTTEAREIIAKWLAENGLLIKQESIKQNVATAERTSGIIEPLPKLQWFVDVNKKFKNPKGKTMSLKELMKSAVESGEIKITPDHFSKIYFHWIENLHDWCISRQIWYGHRIPVWYKNKKIYCEITPPKDEGWEQDSDTLDTWFSSGLWTFSTLGWPNETQNLKTFHPTDVLETGYDILFFWVARMILMSTALLGEIPFKNVYLHGIVRAVDKQKMSKSKGNMIDPLDMSTKYGTDALRFALVFNTAPGTDMVLAEDKIKGMKHFGNKLWNIARFVITNLEDYKSGIINQELKPQTEEDKDILTKLDTVIKSSTDNLENFRLHEVAQEIYQFVWHEFADIYIEISKTQLKNNKLKSSTLDTLHFTLLTCLKLLHPFMPFITEHIWSILKEKKLVKDELLIVANWPN